MIQQFKNKGIEDIFNGTNTKEARKTCPRSLWQIATRKLDQLDSINMKCDKCNVLINENEVYQFKGKNLCDDCYIDLVMGIPEVDISQFPPELQFRFRNIKKNWNRNRPIYCQIKFKEKVKDIDS